MVSKFVNDLEFFFCHLKNDVIRNILSHFSQNRSMVFVEKLK